ncbi:MAG: MATE family efflux transporter [Lachnospiraceae bacterium]|nr:MATE family efflux transporter [Lachnospiraceae bacterium]
MTKDTKDLTQGPILPSLIRFAVPLLFAMFLQALYGGVDLLVVGQFATTGDVSGVSTGSTLMHTITMIVTGLAMGLTIYVGQKIGEKNTEEAGRAIGAGIAVFLVCGLIMTVMMSVFTSFFANLMHAPAEAYTQTCAYIRICGLGSVFIVAYNVLGAVFRGIGDSKTPLLTVAISCVFNIFGDLLFVAVFGMGAAGAALATVISQASSVFLSLYIIRKKKLPISFRREYIGFPRRIVERIFTLGAPIALQELLVGVSFLVIQAIVNSIDVVSSAGVGVAEKGCSFIMLISSAISQAMATFVAQNVGAAQMERAKKALRIGITVSLAIGFVIGTFTFFRGDLIAGIFSKDAQVIIKAHEYLRCYAIDTVFTAIMFCWVGYYNGCGHTLFVMTQGLVGALLVRVPVVYLMSRLENTNLFLIGLGTPAATVVQILMCAVFWGWLKKQAEQTAKSSIPKENIT